MSSEKAAGTVTSPPRTAAVSAAQSLKAPPAGDAAGAQRPQTNAAPVKVPPLPVPPRQQPSKLKGPPVAASAAAAAAAIPPTTSPVSQINPYQLLMLSQAVVNSTLPNASTIKRKRGRPKGSKNSKPVQKRSKPAPPESPADEAVKEALKRREKARGAVAKAQANLEKAQKRLDAAERAIADHDKSIQQCVEKQADDRLKDENWKNDNWMLCYKALVAFKEKVEANAPPTHGMKKKDGFHLPKHRKEQVRLPHGRTLQLSRFLSYQRTDRRNKKLEPWKEALLNRVGIDWDPPQGPDGSKWQRRYEELKVYCREHGNCKVPRHSEQYGKLFNWVKTQQTQYRNIKSGKTPPLSKERVKLLEKLGMEWPEEVVRIDWDDRYEALLDYVSRYGDPHVPWRWKGNLALASWVNSQRNKYRDLHNGKPSSLTQEQIAKLEAIGFQWSTGGTRKYERNHPDHPDVAAYDEDEDDNDDDSSDTRGNNG